MYSRQGLEDAGHERLFGAMPFFDMSTSMYWARGPQQRKGVPKLREAI